MLKKTLLGIIATLLFGLIIALHEFGHFITAKFFGIKVNEFAIGMGPKMISFVRGETRYSLRVFPIGGFCAMEGEDSESQDERAFVKKSVWKRMIVVSAGAILNILMGLLLMMTLLVQKPAYPSTTINSFIDHAATQSIGLQKGDQFYQIDSYRIYTAQDLMFALGTANPDKIDIQVVRNGEILSFNGVKLKSTEAKGKKIVELDFKVVPIKKNFSTVIIETGKNAISTAGMVFSTLAGLATGRFGLNEVSGPLGIISTVSQVTEQGLSRSFVDALNSILSTMIMISINLGIMNLLPLPALDGGRFVFLFLEAIRGKPISAKYEGYVHTAGFVLLILLMFFITFHDIMRLISGTRR